MLISKSNKTLLLSYTFFLILLIYKLLFPSELIAGSNPYDDDFNDGNSNGWTEEYLTYCGNAEWKVVNNMYGIKIDNVWGCKTHSILTNLIIPESASYTFEFDMKFSQSINMDRNFLIKYESPSRWYGFHIVGNNIHLEKVMSGYSYTNPFPTVQYYGFTANKIHHFKITVAGATIKLDIDHSSFMHTYQDQPPFLNNYQVGFRAGTGEIRSSEVWFDNVKITTFPHFNLPFYYNTFSTTFKGAFWDQLTASFDHYRKGGKHIPFTGNVYKHPDCPRGSAGIQCYDSHHGTDFKPPLNDKNEKILNVYPVANGKIVFSSKSDGVNNYDCTPNKGGYGCVIIMYHEDLDLYTLYAHLDKIHFGATNNLITTDAVIGEMGNTGCAPKCGVHLHLGVMREILTSTSNSIKMTKNDWQSLLYEIQPERAPRPHPKCLYKAPNGKSFAFLDPSGWATNDKADPWSLSKKEGGCDITSDYLWTYDVDTEKTNSSQFFNTLLDFVQIE